MRRLLAILLLAFTGDIAAAQDIMSLYPAFTSTLPGWVPSSGGGTSNYLRADGTWAAPSGGGGGCTTNCTFGGTTTISGTLVAPNFTSGAQGLTPLSGGGTINFLRADGTWAVPAGGGGYPSGTSLGPSGTNPSYNTITYPNFSAISGVDTLTISADNQYRSTIRANNSLFLVSAVGISVTTPINIRPSNLNSDGTGYFSSGLFIGRHAGADVTPNPNVEHWDLVAEQQVNNDVATTINMKAGAADSAATTHSAGGNFTIQGGNGGGSSGIGGSVYVDGGTATGSALVGNVVIGATRGVLITAPKTVATLPTCNAGLMGGRSFVTDATVTMAAGVGTAVVGSGANKVPVYCDGTQWSVG